MNKNFPCKTCHHKAGVHYKNIAEDFTVCTDCTPKSETDYCTMNEHIHDFVGDNLGYMELENKKEEIRNARMD